jgi:DNA polymerase III delta prime subunit
MYTGEQHLMNDRHEHGAGPDASVERYIDSETTVNDTGSHSAPVDDHGYPALSLEEITPRVDDILEAAKILASAAKKREKNLVEEEEAEQAARALQKEANDAFEARLAKRVTAEVRSFEDVQKDVLKALKKLDKAVESADEETQKSQSAYKELLSIITPSN